MTILLAAKSFYSAKIKSHWQTVISYKRGMGETIFMFVRMYEYIRTYIDMYGGEIKVCEEM